MEGKTVTNGSSVSPANLIIRFATPDDLEQISQIAHVTWNKTYSGTIGAENRKEFLDRAYTPENLATAIDVPGHWFYLAELDNEIIGFGHFLQRYHRTQPRAELVRLYVLPDYQSLGVGRRILKTGFAALAEAGIEQCVVSVQETNKLARKFYERHGFEYHQKQRCRSVLQCLISRDFARLSKSTRPRHGLDHQSAAGFRLAFWQVSRKS